MVKEILFSFYNIRETKRNWYELKKNQYALRNYTPATERALLLGASN